MTKRICLFLFACLFFISHLSAQMRWNSVYQEYIDQYKDLAIEEMLRYNIPASITLAQGIFESGAGRSELSVKGNNHFGIKCHGWTGRSVYHDDDARNECFRAYDNVLQSYEDHSKFLRYNVRYNSLFTLQRTDYRGWAQGLKACGYATNPRYADKLIELIELYKLYELDKATSYDKFMAKRGGYDKPVSQGMSLHPIKIYNKNYYIIARAGDTFKGIGEEIDISYRKIAKYNERDKHDVLHAGEIIYLKKKQKKADKVYKNRPHIVKAGESMYSIAQRYGIRLKSLYKKNHLSPDYQARVGDTLRVY
ncbi:glucosaminidase domain-containing protein [Segatella maculosa]|uniref:glucosaminidase domain-containing protein n=1 Tax=Segatella maculosa TaxID=439703 RepID=UPI0003738F73|nr:glucosaminidase domain-containing protein [Segatella maculosa]